MRLEPSFLPSIIDRMMPIRDVASIPTIWWLESVISRKCGGSTGTNVFGTLQIIGEMLRDGERGSVLMMICDSSDRYLGTYMTTVDFRTRVWNWSRILSG